VKGNDHAGQDVRTGSRAPGGRRFAENDEEAQMHLSSRGEQLVAQAQPELSELVRLGGSWHVLSAAAAALTAVPSTTSGLSLWNGEPDNGKCYAIDSFGTVEIVTDATQQNSLALFASLSVGKITAPTDAGLVKASLSGRAASGTLAKVAAGATTLAADVWSPHGPSTPGATAFAGAVWRVTETMVRGLYLVRPGGQFSIAAAKVAATASQIRYFIRWHEIQLPYQP
jgi:hypothetical protein